MVTYILPTWLATRYKQQTNSNLLQMIPNLSKITKVLDDMDLQDFSERQLSYTWQKVDPVQIPVELVDLILDQVFESYLLDFNFDMVRDLLEINKSFLLRHYRKIYGETTANLITRYRRLNRTFQVVENIHDCYITEKIKRADPIVRLVSNRFANSQPWHYCFDVMLEPLGGTTQLEDSDLETYAYANGPLYGNICEILGKFEDAEFVVHEIHSPVINISLTDIYDTVNQTADSLKSNEKFKCFSTLMRRIYGPYLTLNYMVHGRDINPFLVITDTFIEL